jgi:hypothetical protein
MPSEQLKLAAASTRTAARFRVLGALDPLGQPQAPASAADTPPAVPADLAAVLQAPAYAIYAEEGRAGGISLITALYQR